MIRVTHSTKAVDLFGPGKHGYQDGPPTSTVLTSAAFNPVQEEIARTVEGYGGILTAGVYDQMYAQLRMAQVRDSILSSTMVDTGTTTDITGICAVEDAASDENLMWSVAVGYGGKSAYCLGTGSDVTWNVGGAFAGAYVGNMHGVLHAVQDGKIVAYGATGEIQTAPSAAGSLVWTAVKTGGSDIRCVESNSSGNIYLAVSADGHVWASSDTTTWVDTLGTNLVGTDIRDISHRPEADGGPLWMVADNGQVRTSADGGVWTTRVVPGSGQLRSCRWISRFQLWVVAGDEGAYTSSDGITWTQRVDTGSVNGCNYIAELPTGVLVAGEGFGGSTSGWYTSTDGVTWLCGNHLRLSGLPSAGTCPRPVVCLHYPQVNEYKVVTAHTTNGNIRLCRAFSA